MLIYASPSVTCINLNIHRNQYLQRKIQRVYCNIRIHCWNISSRDPKCLRMLGTQKYCCISLLLIANQFRYTFNKTIFYTQSEKLWATLKILNSGTLQQKFNKLRSILIISQVFLPLLQSPLHLFSIRTWIVTLDVFLFWPSRGLIDTGTYWSVTKYTTFIVNTLLKTSSATSSIDINCIGASCCMMTIPSQIIQP